MNEAMIGAYYASRPAASGRAKTARSGNCPLRRGHSDRHADETGCREMGLEPSRRGLILLASTDRHGVAGSMIDIREKRPRCARGGPACWTGGSRRVRFPGLRGCGRAGRSRCWFR